MTWHQSVNLRQTTSSYICFKEHVWKELSTIKVYLGSLQAKPMEHRLEQYLNNRMKSLEFENAKLVGEVMQVRNLLHMENSRTGSFEHEHDTSNNSNFIFPKKAAVQKIDSLVTDHIPLKNRFGSLAYVNNDQTLYANHECNGCNTVAVDKSASTEITAKGKGSKAKTTSCHTKQPR